MGRRKSDRWLVWVVGIGLVLNGLLVAGNLTLCALNIYYIRRFHHVVTTIEKVFDKLAKRVEENDDEHSSLVKPLGIGSEIAGGGQLDKREIVREKDGDSSGS